MDNSIIQSLHRHFIVHKPYGMLSQFVRYERQRRNKKMLGLLHDFPEGTMSVGRLDEKSEGLLILTTDGQMSYDIRSKEVEKEYFVQVDGDITEEAIMVLRSGVEIGFNGKKYWTQPCKASKIPDPGFEARKMKIRDDRHGPTSWLSVRISEGKFRQVRKMTAAVGFPTLRLVRVRIGGLRIDEYKSGYVEEISTSELTKMIFNNNM